jgi:hypothetical protein
MRDDDQYLLLFIARKMADRAARRPGIRSQDIRREPNGKIVTGRVGGNS